MPRPTSWRQRPNNIDDDALSKRIITSVNPRPGRDSRKRTTTSERIARFTYRIIYVYDRFRLMYISAERLVWLVYAYYYFDYLEHGRAEDVYGLLEHAYLQRKRALDHHL